MAALVDFLVSDNSAAASGSVQFYQLGTTTVSGLVYSDADGQDPETEHDLDEYGSITRYVGEPVDVVLYDSDGATLKTVPFITDAKIVRVNNAIATGPSPTGDGTTISAGNTTVDAIYTQQYTSLGADDGYALGTGGETLIKNGLSPFFNVVTYGAAGNGTGDDTAALQAAITAAGAAGGGVVYLPAGTYKTTGALNVTVGVTIMGEGAATTSIKQFTSGTNGWLTITADDVIISGITFARDTTSMTGRAIDSTKRTHIYSCVFDGFNGAHLYGNGATADIRATSCRFTQTEASGVIGTGSTAAATIRMSGCILVTSVASATGFAVTAYLTNCEWGITATSGTCFNSTSLVTWTGGAIASTTTSGTITVSTGVLQITGARITTGASGTLRLTNSGTIMESGCYFGSSDVVVGTPSANTNSYSHTRDRRRSLNAAVSGTSYTPDPEYGIHEIEHTSGASMAIANPSSTGHVGWPLVILYKNGTGGAITVTPGSAYDYAGAYTVGNGQVLPLVFMKAALAVISSSTWSNIGGAASTSGTLAT